MSAPNIVNVATITGKTAYVKLTDTNLTTVVNNPASSGKLIKVISLYVCNIDGTNACDVTISLCSQDDIGGTEYQIASTVAVPADSALVIIDKNAPINLEEDKSIGAKASAANDLVVIASYEELS